MERQVNRIKDKDTKDTVEHIYRNALGNPVVLKSEPTSAQMKANTIGKVKDATDYVYIKFADGKTVKVPVSEVS